MHTKKLIKYFEKKYNKKLSCFGIEEWLFISISQNPYLTEEFIREFKNDIYWANISYYQKLSGEFIQEFKGRIYFNHFSKHNKINWLKYKLKNNMISNEQYLKELIKTKGETK